MTNPKLPPGLSYITPRQRTHGPRTAAQGQIWGNRRLATQTRPLPPVWGDTIVREPGLVPDDEMDAGFYGALVSAMVVGESLGQVPMMVALRLYRAGLVRVVRGAANDNAANDNGPGE